MNAVAHIRAIDALTFLTPQTLDERVALAMGTAGQRLYSHHLANAWLEWIGAHSQEIGRHDVELLAREALRLSPLHERADDLYRAVMRPQDRLPGAHAGPAPRSRRRRAPAQSAHAACSIWQRPARRAR